MALRIVLHWQGPRQHTVKRATGPSQTIGSHHPKAAPPAIQIQMAIRIVLHWQGPRQHTVKRATGPSQTIGSHHPNHDTLSHTITLIKMLNTTYNLQNTTYCEFIGCSNDLLASGFSIFPRQLYTTNQPWCSHIIFN